MRWSRLTFLVLPLLLLAVGCRAGADTTRTAPVSPTRAAITVTVSAGATPPTRPGGLTEARVARVVDGDTIDVALNGRRERVRLIGIDTPESVDPNRPVQCFGPEASERTKTLLTGAAVALEPDPTQGERDRYGRLLRYVWLADGHLFNLEMLADGYARIFNADRRYRYYLLFRDTEQAARAAGRGLWSSTTCDGRTAAR